MKWLATTLVTALTLSAPAFAGVEGYYRFPTTNGQRIVFAAEGDLWEVPMTGGQAVRLTTHTGEEWFPKFSPDGKRLAFSAEYEGNTDVYVMPAGGGEPQRLTYHPDGDAVVAWTADSKNVVFRSRRESGQPRELYLFEVPVDGGFPQELNIGIGTLASFSPDGRYIAFNRLSREFRNWKRYRGGTAQDIWVGDLDHNKFWKMTDFTGTDAFPMWHNGRVYFLSDRTGRMNIYSCKPDGSDVRQHTNHADYDVRWPDMHDGTIVYMYAGGLRTLNVDSGADKAVNITLPTDRIRTLPRFEDAARTLEGFDINEDGSRVTIGSRGEIWTVPVKGGRTVALNETPAVRERQPVFSPDGKHVAAITDETGEQEIEILDPMGKVEHRILTDGGKGWIFEPVWSPDSKHIAYADLTQTLYVVDVDTGKRSIVDDHNAWEITEYTFSPDSKWLAYTKPFGAWTWDQSIYLYNLADGKTYPVTTRFTGDHSPAWDPEGRYLYFISSRDFDPYLGSRDFEFITMETEVPCLVVLASDGVPPFVSDEIKTLYGPKDEDAGKDREKGDESAADADDEGPFEDADEGEPEVPDVRIDLAGIENRVFEFPVDAGNFTGLTAIDGKLFYMSYPTDGLLDMPFGGDDTRNRMTLNVYDFKDKKEDVFVDKLRDYRISTDGQKIAYLVGDTINIASTGAPPDKPDDTVSPHDLRLSVIPQDEWKQIYWEAWRLQRDFYWAPNMAGINWKAVGDSYAKLLPRISTRDELNDLIGQLIGELSTSHTYVWGGDVERSKSVSVGLLGADVRPAPQAHAYRIERIFRPEAWESDVDSPLTMPYAGVHDGDYLFAINNRDLTDTDNIYQRLADLADAEVLLTIGSKPDRSDARDVQIKTIPSETDLRYRDWCRRKRQYVEAQSSGRIGYFHLPDMDAEGLNNFIQGFYPQADKDALIIDCRYNGGGFVSQMIMDRLARKLWAYSKPRRGKADTYPQVVHVGPKVLLTNYFSGSDGDIGPETFRLKQLGPIIGTRSWGGVIGIRADKQFIDGGMSTQPEFAWLDPTRGWDLENVGVKPDIIVDITPADYANAKDPQLDAGIQYLMDQLDKNPPKKMVIPPYPDKSLKVGER